MPKQPSLFSRFFSGITAFISSAFGSGRNIKTESSIPDIVLGPAGIVTSNPLHESTPLFIERSLIEALDAFEVNNTGIDEVIESNAEEVGFDPEDLGPKHKDKGEAFGFDPEDTRFFINGGVKKSTIINLFKIEDPNHELADLLRHDELVLEEDRFGFDPDVIYIAQVDSGNGKNKFAFLLPDEKDPAKINSEVVRWIPDDEYHTLLDSLPKQKSQGSSVGDGADSVSVTSNESKASTNSKSSGNEIPIPIPRTVIAAGRLKGLSQGIGGGRGGDADC